jgi:hypothetical protein
MALITTSDVRTYAPELSAGVADAKVRTYIDQAEIKDVRPEIGSAFWVAIVTTPASYTDLLDGGNYTYAGKTYNNPGLKEVIARYTFARYARYGATTDTPFGMLVKQNPDAREISKAEKDAIYYENRQIAYEQWTHVRAFLSRNSSDYPLWSCGTTRAFNIQKITK